jgi:hypothetical protein
MSDLESEQTPHLCPRCQQPAGRAYKYADDGSSLRVLIRCGLCQHRWSALLEKAARK